MKHALFLAMRSLWWYRGRSGTIIACLAITLWLPVSVRLMLDQFQDDITARARATPLLIGAAGSRIDLAMHCLYFEGHVAATTTLQQADHVSQSGYAEAIPLYVRYRTQNRNDHPGVAIVGTSPEYFEFRRLQLAQGQSMAVLGDCVVGSRAAEQLGVAPGDFLLSAPQNAFDLAGDYPLKMHVTGILAPARSPDDNVVFVDTQTVWIIDGIGHGHQQLTPSADDSLLLKSSGNQVTASAAVLPYTEITADNIDSFHFHGDPAEFPISAVIAVPHSERDRILLRGRYEGAAPAIQCLQPVAVVGELMNIVFRVEELVRITSAVALAVTTALLGLVLVLSVRLREKEMATLFQLGCSRALILRMLAAEITLLLLLSTMLAFVAALLTRHFSQDLLHRMLF